METSEFLKKCALFCIRVLMVALVLLCTGCVSMLRMDGPYEGKVIDSATRQPLEGVVVHGDWYTVWGTVGGASSEWHDSYEVLTDKNGEFRIPGKGLLVLSSIDELDLTIFKAGYEQITPSTWAGIKQWKNQEVYWEGNRPTFRLKKLTMEERRKKGVVMPVGVRGDKLKLMKLESNKENIELGLPANTLYKME